LGNSTTFVYFFLRGVRSDATLNYPWVSGIPNPAHLVDVGYVNQETIMLSPQKNTDEIKLRFSKKTRAEKKENRSLNGPKSLLPREFPVKRYSISKSDSVQQKGQKGRKN
jgi:hypothetical protein